MKRLLTFLALTCAAVASFGATLNPVQLLNPVGSAVGQAIVSTGVSSAPAWGNITATALAAQAANTVVANVTASSASPTAFAMPSCSTSSSALQWTSGAGFGCLTGLAPLASPTFTGIPISPAPSNATNNGQIATTSFVYNMLASGLATITPSQTGGIVGTTTNNNANAGSVGEYAANTSSGISMATGTPVNCTSVSLTAGDWDVQGIVTYSPGASMTVSGLITGVNSTSATFGSIGGYVQSNFSTTISAAQTYASPVTRLSISATTTAYVVGQASFSGSTMTCAGAIRARRVR